MGLLPRTVISFVAVVALFILLMIWTRSTLSFQPSLPAPTGQHVVGRAEFDWIDGSRPDPIVGPANRELDSFVWYPAKQPGTRPAIYLRDNWLRVSNMGFGSPVYKGVQTHSWEDAEMAVPKPTGWPVVILSSGLGGLPIEYTSFSEELASHGYVVAAAANTWAGPTVVFPDGRVARSRDQQGDPSSTVRIWADDIGTVLNELAKLNDDPRSQFFQKLDLKHVGIAGHSFGGAASAEFCSQDSRCIAGVDMDGGLYGSVIDSGIQKPFLFLLSEGTPPYWMRIRPALRRKAERIHSEAMAGWQNTCSRSSQCRIEVMPGFRHMNFSDLAVLFRPPLDWAHPALGSVGGVKGLEITRHKLLDFLNRWVPV